MTYQTINRAIAAARCASDPLVRSAGQMLQATHIHLIDQVARIEHEWRMEAMKAAHAEGHKWYTQEEAEATERHYERIKKARGPVSPHTLTNKTAPRATNPILQAVAVARALLAQLGEGQGGEVWPGQYAYSEQHGRVKVVGLSMDGQEYDVLLTGWGTYPTDPTVTVPASQIQAVEPARTS